MNSINLSRFYKFSGSNFKKKIKINKTTAPLISAQFADSNPEKKLTKKIKIKIYSKLYIEFLSFPLFLGSEDGKLLYYSKTVYLYYQKKLGRIPKKLQVES